MTTTEVFHKAAQYLAAASKSFIPPASDDSHTSLRWDPSENVLRTGPLNDEGLTLELNHQVYALDVVHPRSGLSGSFALSGARHFNILQWLVREREFCGIKEPFAFDLHYTLPYETKLDDAFVYPSIPGPELDQEIEHRSKADAILKTTRDSLDQRSAIRIWPHHFDAAFSIQPEGSSITFIGMGVAIPDEVSAEHYIYLNAYEGNRSIDTKALPVLEVGEWRSGDWNGAVLPLSESTEESGKRFLKDAYYTVLKAYP